MTIETKYNIGDEVWIYPHIYHETINNKVNDNNIDEIERLAESFFKWVEKEVEV